MPLIPPTFGGLKLEVARLTREYEAGDLTSDYLGFEQVCREVTAAVARELPQCLWGEEIFPTTTGQAVYTLARVFDLHFAYVKDSTGTNRTLNLMDEKGIERWDDRRRQYATTATKPWTDFDPVDVPTTLVKLDNDTVQLVPPPAADRDPGVVFRGWAEPEPGWTEVSGDASPFPLAPRYLPYTALRVALRLMTEAGRDTGKIIEATTNELSSLVADKTPAAGVTT